MTEIVRIYAGFDGTYNNMDNDIKIGDSSETNIAKLRTLYAEQGYIDLYQEGSGTEPLTDLQIELVKSGQAQKTEFYNSVGGGFGIGETGVHNQVSQMMTKVSPFIRDIADTQVLYIDIAGFSRGAAAARDFINQMHTQYEKQIASGKVVLDNVILYDTVASIGLANSVNIGIDLELSVTSANKIYHFTALNEERSNFPLESLRDENGHLPANIFEQALWGVHADLGAGYGLNDSIEKLVIESGKFSVLNGDINTHKSELIEQALAQGLHVEFTSLGMGSNSGIERFAYDFYETRVVELGLANISLALTIQRLSENGVELANPSVLGVNSEVDEELNPYLNALINGDDISQFEDLVAAYTHTSNSNDKLNVSLKDLISHFRDLNEERDIYFNEHGTLESWWDDVLQNIGRQIIKKSMATGDDIGALEIGILHLLNATERGIVEFINDFTSSSSDINQLVHTHLQSALDFVFRRDPLVLDLDGDGIETTPADGSVLFDHNADNQKTATGWIAPDDGLLVLDRNNNGTIDTGRELFGDSTLKSNGELATNGFDALADLDSNQDGLVDVNDTEFANLRIWQDLNQDGISQNNELKTLEQLNIQSITTAGENVLQNLDHNNQAIAAGSFTFNDGTTSTAGAAASLNLAVNNFHREFTDTIVIPYALQSLPDMTGSGDIRDLKQASALSPTLANLLETYSNASSKEEQLAQLDGLLDAWADTANFKQLTDRIDDAQIGETSSTLKFRITKPKDVDIVLDTANSEDEDLDISPYYAADELAVGRFPDRRNVDVLAKIQMLEVFNNQQFFDFSIQEQNNDADTEIDDALVSIGTGNTSRTVTYQYPDAILPSELYLDETNLTLSEQQITFVEQAYDALKQSIYDGLLLQTRLAPLIDGIELNVVDNRLVLDFTVMEGLMQQAIDAHAVDGLIDVIEFNRVSQGQLQQTGWRGSWSFLGEALGTLTITTEVQAVLDDEHIRFLAAGDTANLVGSDLSGVLVGNELDNVITSSSGTDIINGGGGNDQITSSGHNDTLHGDAGDDILTASTHSNDTTLHGGTGTDSLTGSYYNDTYLFNLGDGFDTITELGQSLGSDDILKFGLGIVASDLTVTRQENDLILSHENGRDQIKITDWYRTAGYQLEQFYFNDGTVLSGNVIHDAGLIVNGTEGDDTLTNSTRYADTFNGMGGNDILVAGSHSRGTILHGGTGTDSLTGSYYNDTYLFNLGDGFDTITELGQSLGSDDILKFGLGIVASDLTVTRQENDLILSHENGRDQIKITDWYRTAGYQLEQFYFNDGTVWSREFVHKVSLNTAPILNNVLINKIGDENSSFSYQLPIDTFTDSDEDDTLSLSVTLTDGSDLPDWLSFDAQSHTFSGTAPLDASGEYIINVTATDSFGLTAESQFTLTINDINPEIIGGTGNETLTGTEHADVINSGEGDDVLIGGAGNDTLIAGIGSDWLQGGSGDDTLVISEDASWTEEFSAFNAGSLGKRGTGERVSITAMQRSHDLFDGGEGIDTAQGSDGNDAIFLDDALSPLPNGGGPRVQSIERFNMGAGDDIVDLTSADYDYHDAELNGEAGNDVLWGSSGNDTLNGGQGNDKLSGGTGDDTYLFGRGDGHDTVRNYDPDSNSTDTLQFGDDITSEQLWFEQAGRDLKVSVLGSDDDITVKNWYGGNGRHELDVIELSSGEALINNQLDLLVQAMASFGAPAAGETELSGQIKEELSSVIASSWG